MPLAGSALAVAGLVLIVGVALGGGGTSTVEGGAYFDYVAPDPLGPTDGAIRFGFSGTVETIAADAVLTPPADTNLSFFGGGTPTCLGVTREGGVITALQFAPNCTVSGTVTRVDDLFGPGGDAYLIADRVAAPAELVEGNPQFGTVIGVPAAAGTNLAITFELDLTSGVPVAFVAQTSVAGAVTLLSGGDVGVGAATLPTAVVDATARGQLEEAAALGVDATVGILGNGSFEAKGDPALDVLLSVDFTAPTPVATPVPTAAPSAGALPDTSSGREPGSAIVVGWLGVGLIGLGGAGRGLAVRRRRIG